MIPVTSSSTEVMASSSRTVISSPSSSHVLNNRSSNSSSSSRRSSGSTPGSSSSHCLSSSVDVDSMSNGTHSPEVRVDQVSRSEFLCCIQPFSSLNDEYSYSNLVLFASKTWKIGTKRLKNVFSFLIYPINCDDDDEDEDDEGEEIEALTDRIRIRMTIVSDDHPSIHVEGCRQFVNNTTIFVWTSSIRSLQDYIESDQLRVVISFAHATNFNQDLLSDPEIIPTICNNSSRSKPEVESKSMAFPIILTGIRGISDRGITSPVCHFENASWELKMCQNGSNLYAFRLMCNRKAQQKQFKIWAKVQLTVRGESSSSMETIHVEGSRCFFDADDSIFWSFDRKLDRFAKNDALEVKMVISVYKPKEERSITPSESSEVIMCQDYCLALKLI